jgi:hypothetical protein
MTLPKPVTDMVRRLVLDVAADASCCEIQHAVLHGGRLLRPPCRFKQFTEERIRDQAVLTVARRTGYKIDPRNPYPAAFTGHLRAALRDGSVQESARITSVAARWRRYPRSNSNESSWITQSTAAGATRTPRALALGVQGSSRQARSLSAKVSSTNCSFQWAVNTGKVAFARMCRVVPPKIIWRNRLCV